MVEVEWEGVELDAGARRWLTDVLEDFARVADPDGRARLEVAIVAEPDACVVSVAARDAVRAVGIEARHSNVRSAIREALELARARWESAARGEAATARSKLARRRRPDFRRARPGRSLA